MQKIHDYQFSQFQDPELNRRLKAAQEQLEEPLQVKVEACKPLQIKQ